MADNSLNRIQAAARAMEELVLPAVDASNPIAREQAGLVAATLRMLEQQLPLMRDRDAYELRCTVHVGRQLLGDADGELRSYLVRELEVAEDLLARVGPSAEELREANQRIAAGTSALVRAVTEEADDATTEAVFLRVLESSADLIEGQRSWFSRQGWAGPPVPPPEELLRRAPQD